MWNNKLRASGQNNNTNPYGSGGAYEYLATEIYGYTYEQGNHYVYLKDVTKRFEVKRCGKSSRLYYQESHSNELAARFRL